MGSEGKKSTKCVFLFDVNRNQTKSEEEGRNLLFSIRASCNEVKAFKVSGGLCLGGGGGLQYVITHQQNHIHYTNCCTGPCGWGLERGGGGLHC